MKKLDKLNLRAAPGMVRSEVLVMLLGAVLAGCGGGGSSPPPGGSGPPPAPAPVPPPPPPPPPPVSTVPPLSPTVVNLDDNHQVGVNHWPVGDSATGAQGATTAGLDCLANPVETYHVHSHLSIFLNGEALSVPGEIGIVDQGANDCFYPLHTHDRSGKIHVEAAAPALFTLGQLFSIWGEELMDTNIGDITGLPSTDIRHRQWRGNRGDRTLERHRAQVAS